MANNINHNRVSHGYCCKAEPPPPINLIQANKCTESVRVGIRIKVVGLIYLEATNDPHVMAKVRWEGGKPTL